MKIRVRLNCSEAFASLCRELPSLSPADYIRPMVSDINEAIAMVNSRILSNPTDIHSNGSVLSRDDIGELMKSSEVWNMIYDNVSTDRAREWSATNNEIRPLVQTVFSEILGLIMLLCENWHVYKYDVSTITVPAAGDITVTFILNCRRVYTYSEDTHTQLFIRSVLFAIHNISFVSIKKRKLQYRGRYAKGSGGD